MKRSRHQQVPIPSYCDSSASGSHLQGYIMNRNCNHCHRVSENCRYWYHEHNYLSLAMRLQSCTKGGLTAECFEGSSMECVDASSG